VIGSIMMIVGLAGLVVLELVARRAERRRRAAELARWADSSPEAARARLDAARGRW
jgi:hypothetical protein